jgi:N-succinyldiaminopimelate aminotransferase
MDIQQSDASFYLWPKTPICDQVFAKELYQQQAVTVVPGSYLSRTVDGTNPGQGRIRIALVAPIEQCIEAAKRIRTYLSTLDK